MVEDVRPSDLQRLFDSLLDAGYAPGTCDQIRRQLSAFFNFAKVPNPARRSETSIPVRESEARSWADAELRSIRAAADAHGMRLPVELALATGARLSELLAIERRDFSDAHRTVRIYRQITVDATAYRRLKSGRSRTAVVLPELWEHLPSAPGLIIPGPTKPRAARDTMQSLLDDAGLYSLGVGWHRCRHTYARRYLELGGWMDELQRSLGHASQQTTERIYGHFAPERAASFAVSRIYGKGRHLRAI